MMDFPWGSNRPRQHNYNVLNRGERCVFFVLTKKPAISIQLKLLLVLFFPLT